ncbi:flavin reductase family protein [Roseateles sp. NT4]|uniref:flavin reductase family protein n=1 Tax=Roseateles sp. NT4 TaxID=3453715 RepID=UPI003EE9D0F6
MRAISIVFLQMSNSITIRPSVLYFGTPVAILSTTDGEGQVNLTPMSSIWALGDRLVLGLAEASQGCANLLAQKEVVVNLPGPAQQAAVERLAPTTGRWPVPVDKTGMGYRHEADKFALAGWTPVPALQVRPPRVAECPLQLEARLLAAHECQPDAGGNAPPLRIIEVQVVKVHAHRGIVHPGTQHVDTDQWSPLLYVFRHYFGTGSRLERNFRAET